MNPSAQETWPSQTEIIIGLVGPVGIDLNEVFTKVASVLSRFKYECHDLHLSDQLKALDWDQDLVDQPADARLWSYMSAGNRLCEAWQRNDVFALLAVNAILLARAEAGGEPDKPLHRHAYILRSLKRPEEAELLRQIYGDRFVLLSLYSPRQARVAYLDRRIRDSRRHPVSAEPDYTAEQLVARDEKEADSFGQDVRGIFHQGDFFIDVRSGLEGQVTRAMELLFGHPNRTPTRDEAGMFHAVAAGRQSAELGRQVGAAICTTDGSVVAVGTNEVPKAGGGHYWEGDLADAREFTKGVDSSDIRKATIVNELIESLQRDELVKEDVSADMLRENLSKSRVDDLIEFVRAVHAEMAAISDAARRGSSVQGSVMYVTTFPCHTCSGHIVGAGVSRVIYIAPYPKSLARELHDDAIDFDPVDSAPAGKITFEPFVGVGPARYLDVFHAPARKDRETGDVLKFEPEIAEPRIRDREAPEMQGEVAAYIFHEQRAIEVLSRVQEPGDSPHFRIAS